MQLLSAVLVFSMAAQATAPDALTADGLRAWMTAGGAFESNARLIHAQMQQQKASLPPWWPDDVYAQEEDAILKVDFVDAGLQFYQPCFNDPEAHLLAKMAATKVGQQVSQTSLQTHSQAAENGASPVDAQKAGEDAAHKKAEGISAGDKEQLAASLTPEEMALAAKSFTPAKAAVLKQCMDQAFAKTADVMKTRQTTAVQAVIEVNRSRLVAAKTQWGKDHPEKAP